MESFIDQLAEDVTFNSPVATYHGRADVEHLLAIISGVVYGYNVDRELTGPDGEIVSFVSGKISGHEVNGVIARNLNDAGEITELTLMLRPLKALMAGVEQMAQALAASPLPSARN
jgi:hypothetical protein